MIENHFELVFPVDHIVFQQVNVLTNVVDVNLQLKLIMSFYFGEHVF